MFPIAVQAPQDYKGNEPNADLELLVEILELAVDFVGKALHIVAATLFPVGAFARFPGAAARVFSSATHEGRLVPTVRCKAFCAAEISHRMPSALQQRAQLAANEVTPYVVLRQLSRDPSDEVRNSLVLNSAIGCDILDRLAADGNRFIAAQARGRRDLVCNYSQKARKLT